MQFALAALLYTLAGAGLILADSFFHPSERERFSETELLFRSDGDVSVFYGRKITREEVRARDLAIAAITGGDGLEARELLDTEEIEELALRYLDIDQRDVELEPRLFKALVKGVAKGIEKIISVIKDQIEKDKGRRGEYTTTFIAKAMDSSPRRNWVMCHTKHRHNFDGTQGIDWSHSHEEFNVAFGKTVGFEVYSFKSGNFTREGDGGYLNWAYGGNIKEKSEDGTHLTFGER